MEFAQAHYYHSDKTDIIILKKRQNSLMARIIKKIRTTMKTNLLFW